MRRLRYDDDSLPGRKKGKDGQPYLYYACTSVTQEGSASPCPVRSLPAREFETLIKSVLIDLGADRAMLESCVQAANREALIPIKDLEEQQKRHREEVARLTTASAASSRSSSPRTMSGRTSAVN